MSRSSRWNLCRALLQPEDIAAQTAKMERRANAGDAAKQAKIRDMKVRALLDLLPAPPPEPRRRLAGRSRWITSQTNREPLCHTHRRP